MESLWSDKEASLCNNDALKLRAYTSKLLGRSDDLVLHGGGNTSVKINEKNIFGEEEEILYVKGSGWDLKTIEPQGFAPVKMEILKKLGALEKLSDFDMVKESKAAMTNPSAPAPSIEAILHALIPFKFVDHTHADAVVTLSNTPGGKEILEQVMGERVLILPYIMAGFILSRQVYEYTRDIDWKKIDGIILMSHGVFTFDQDAKKSYEKMIEIVSKAENYLKEKKYFQNIAVSQAEELPLIEMAKMRKKAGEIIGFPVYAHLKNDQYSVGFSNLVNAKELVQRGPLTPDHVIHTKRTGAFINENDGVQALENFTNDYLKYFEKNKLTGMSCLDTLARYAIWPKKGIVTFAQNMKRVQVISDIVDHTIKAIQWAEQIGAWKALSEKDIFEVEYWELEQAKLKSKVTAPRFEGKVVLVTGAASGIGKAVVENFLKAGAAVVGLDVNNSVVELNKSNQYLGLVCDVTSTTSIQNSIKQTILKFGGLDIVISNAGAFPKSQKIEELDDQNWQKGMSLNLESHFKVLRECIPFLKYGFESNIVFVGSKNVPAPGPGAAAYSSAKAGLAQLARVAALELAEFGIRVNTVHPNAVFDTGVWTPEVLESRAKSYGLSIEEYKKNNLLKTVVTSNDVAQVIAELANNTFAKTTGAQIPIDGGNDRVI